MTGMLLPHDTAGAMQWKHEEHKNSTMTEACTLFASLYTAKPLLLGKLLQAHILLNKTDD